MRLVHQALVYFGLRDPTPGDQTTWALAEPAPWWRMLIPTVIAVAVLTGVMWGIGRASFGDALGRSTLIGILIVSAAFMRERLERRRRPRERQGPR